MEFWKSYCPIAYVEENRKKNQIMRWDIFQIAVYTSGFLAQSTL